MNAVPTRNPSGASDLEALSTAFASFVRVTEELRGSYEKLRERADRIDQELSIANESLRQKVAELDHLSGRLNGILAAIPSGVVVCDPEGRVTAWNEAAERLLGVSSKEALGRAATQIRDAEQKPFLLSGDTESARAHGERERTTQRGRKAVLGGAISSIRDGEGRTVGTVEIVEDLTELWNLRERIHRLDKLAALGEMSAVIAHEIRNPLNGVQGFADLISRKLAPTDEKLAGYARNILRGVREVDAIIGDLLAFASPERLAHAPVELGAAIAQAAECARQGISAEQSARIRLHIDLPESGLRIAGDPIKCGQVFRNLFSNAIDAMPQGGTIHVAGRIDGGAVRVDVEDEGGGIPVDVREKVFDPFFTTKTQGTGLGLAIVRKLVELHGGAVAVAQGSSGAKFELSFPKHFEAEEGA